MDEDKIKLLERALAREKNARKAAEKILEDKSAELFLLTQKLKESNNKLEKLVAEKTNQLEGVFENIVDAYVVMDLQGNVLKMNDAAVNLLGFTEEDSQNLMGLVVSTELEKVEQSFKKLVNDGSITNFHVQINTKNKGLKLVHINGSIIYDEKQQPIAAQGIVRDITKDKEAEEKLIESEKRLSSLILNLDSGILLEDENRCIALTNKKFCDLFHIPVAPDLLIGQDCSQAAEQSKGLFKNPDEFVSRIDEILSKKEMVLAEELVMDNGVILERDYVPIYNGEIYKGHLWSYKDVTIKKNFKESLEAQKQKYSNIIANMNLGLVEVNTDDEILMVNHSFEEMSGFTETELIGKKGKETLLHKDSQDLLSQENKKRLKGDSNSYEVKAIKKNGELRYWLISGAPNYNINGEVTGSIGIHLDITELKNLELQKESLLQKLEKSNQELNEYAHVVSHDLKSPLRSLNALVSWLKEDNIEKLDSDSINNIALIESTLEKMDNLISDILNYSSVTISNNEMEEVNLQDMVSDLIDFIYCPEHIKVSLKSSLPTINGDKARLQQVFQNLISNAIKFIDKEKGLVEIDCVDKETYYQFSVRDNGIGIEQEYHNKIFKIFQSLNKREDSSGIGLSIVKKIIEKYKGEIWLESTPGVGTTFYFTLKK